MATRSRIAIENQDGTVKSIYCHWGGYVLHNGRMLFNHYDNEKLEKLIELGDISVLGESIKDTIAFHRDRGEDHCFQTHSRVEALFETNEFIDYIYCLNSDGIWLVQKYNSLHVNILQEELEEEGI